MMQLNRSSQFVLLFVKYRLYWLKDFINEGGAIAKELDKFFLLTLIGKKL